jgi:predicted  nucleic acid-binding Zn-ribbon protein
VERLRAELAEVTAARNAAQQQLEQVIHDRDQETLAVQRLTVANRNCQRMLVHVMNQRDEAWHEENILRARQVELEQQLENAEEYNDNLHEEVHRLNNQLNPLLPRDNNVDEEMGSGVFMAEDDDEVEVNGPQDAPPEEEPEEEEEDEELEPVSDEDGGEILDTDSEDDA